MTGGYTDCISDNKEYIFLAMIAHNEILDCNTVIRFRLCIPKVQIMSMNAAGITEE